MNSGRTARRSGRPFLFGGELIEFLRRVSELLSTRPAPSQVGACFVLAMNSISGLLVATKKQMLDDAEVAGSDSPQTKIQVRWLAVSQFALPPRRSSASCDLFTRMPCRLPAFFGPGE